MSQFEKQLHKAAGSTKLSTAEKQALRERVVSYMEYHPMREKAAAEKAEAYIAAQSHRSIVWPGLFARAMMGAFAVFIFVLVPAVAERAMPGDVLYPIKVKVNEEIRGSLTFSAAEKIEWETERLERRIAEVRLLESEGKLTEEVSAEAAKAVKAHAEAAQDGINKLKTTDEEEAALAEVMYESALEVQTAVFDGVQKKASSTVSGADQELATVVREAKDVVSAGKSTTTPSYEKVSARIEEQTTRAYELFSSLEPVISDDERTEVERRLADIERALEAATVEYDLESEESVKQADLLEVLADIRKLISFMTDLDVRENVQLDDLVPVVLTDDERQTEIDTVLIEAKAVLETVAAVDQDMIERDEKLSLVLVELEQELLALEATINNASTSMEEREAKASLVQEYVEIVETLLQDIIVPDAIVNTSDVEVETATSSEPVESDVEAEVETATTTDAVAEEGEIATSTVEAG